MQLLHLLLTHPMLRLLAPPHSLLEGHRHPAHKITVRNPKAFADIACLRDAQYIYNSTSASLLYRMAEERHGRLAARVLWDLWAGGLPVLMLRTQRQALLRAYSRQSI